MDGLIPICPICGQRTVTLVNTSVGYLHYVCCWRVADCGYRSPDERSDADAITWHNGLIDRLMGFAADAFATGATRTGTFEDWRQARGLA
jgi:hypothetical protein